MNLSIESVDIDAIRTDGGTQVRESLSTEWIDELAALYQEGGHDIEPILCMRDSDGAVWLVDGFHRLAGMRKAGHTSGVATVRNGTLDAAKLLAARMNKNGLPRTVGDKKRAILLARATAEGISMGIRELARHCGVSQAWASEVLGARCSVPNAGHAETGSSGRTKAIRDLRARVDTALRDSDSVPSATLARQLGCSQEVVRGRRLALGLQPMSKQDAAKARHVGLRVKVTAAIKSDLDRSNRSIADELKVTPELVAKARADAGLPARPRGGSNKRNEAQKAPISSAPARRGGDVRDSADVIQFRPRPMVKQLLVDTQRMVERLGDEEREELAEWQRERWPRVFGGHGRGSAGGS
jgi:hypothetical protein